MVAMGRTMIDRTTRDKLADAIHSLIAGFISNNMFNEWLFEHEFDPWSEPHTYPDPAIGPIVEHAYCLYDDLHEYKLFGKHKLSRNQYRDCLRWIIFLQSDVEYVWPPFLFTNRLDTLDRLLSIVTFGKYRSVHASNMSYSEWKESADHRVWPFSSVEEYMTVKARACWFHPF